AHPGKRPTRIGARAPPRWYWRSCANVPLARPQIRVASLRGSSGSGHAPVAEGVPDLGIGLVDLRELIPTPDRRGGVLLPEEFLDVAQQALAGCDRRSTLVDHPLHFEAEPVVFDGEATDLKSTPTDRHGQIPLGHPNRAWRSYQRQGKGEPDLIQRRCGRAPLGGCRLPPD